MALVNFSRHKAKSFTLNVKQSSKPSRIVGTGPHVVVALFNNILDYMKNRKVRLLDLFGILSNEKKVITIASLQKALPVIGINSTKEAIIYFVRALAGQTLSVTYGLFAQGVAQHRRTNRQIGPGNEAENDSPGSNQSRLGNSGHGRVESRGRRQQPTAKLSKVNRSVATEVQRRQSLAHELGTLKLEKVEDEIVHAMHTSSAAEMTQKVAADLKHHVQQFLNEADDNDAMYDQLRSLEESGASDIEIMARGNALQARIRSSLRLGKLAMAIKRRHVMRTDRQIALAKAFAHSVQGLFSPSVDHHDVSASAFNTFADQRIGQQLDGIQEDLMRWCSGSS